MEGNTINNHRLLVVVAGLLVALFGASLGFNGSQVLVIRGVSEDHQAIQNLREADVDIRQREQSDINNLTTLFSKNLDLNRELIELVKVQNELLRTTRK